jgi:hypothetical protein
MPAVPFTIRTLNFVVLQGINGIPANGPHPLSAEATDVAGNRSHQSEELLVTIDSNAPAAPTAADMLPSSDSGTFDNDNVTNIQAPAFQGTGESNARIRIFANGVQVGEGIVGTDLTDPPAQLPNNPPAIGHWEVTVEPLDSGTYTITTQIEDQAGNITTQETSLTIWVDAVLPNTPYLDLTQASDTGRNNQDNITRDNTPTVTSTVDDVQGAATNAFPHDVRYRIYDRPGTGPDVLLVDSFVTIPGLSTSKFFTDTLPVLADGVHNLKLEVEDRAGNVNDFLLQITIDTIVPPVFFGLSTSNVDGLAPGSDSGVNGVASTLIDRITNVTVPSFWGEAEADAIIELSADDGDESDILLGKTVAIPLDGNFAYPRGQWNLTSNVNMNDPNFFPYDGVRTLRVRGEDVAGNVSDSRVLQIFVDTQGPQVTDVFITDHSGFNLFGLKPGNAAQGPTPLVNSITINLQDLPFQDAAFLRDAIEKGVAETPGLITLKGDHNGFIAIADIDVELDPAVPNTPATGSIIIKFYTPLPDDRYTLVIDDALVDIAGNNLDGENNAQEPFDFPFFPSGDGQPGGDFEARFTVDSRPEVGAYAASSIYIDINGNLFYDPQGTGDTTNRDLTFGLGIVPSLEGIVAPFGVHDGLFAGNFSGQRRDEEVGAASAFADGYDKLAAYGFDNTINKFRWLIDTNNDGVIDPAEGDHATIQSAAYQINGLPIAGNFDGDATNGDEIGLFDGTKWYFDTNRNWVIDGGDAVFTLGLRGTPIVGDFNGDGVEDLGTWRNDQFTFNFGSGSPPTYNGGVQATINWGLPGTGDKPVAADMDADGITDIGLYLPERTGVLPLEGGHWEFLISNDYGKLQRGGNQVNALNHPFSPTPLGFDIFSQFGDSFALPIVGNFDPPIAKPDPIEPTALPTVFGTLPMGTQTINGEEWYSFKSLRDGVIAVDAVSNTPGSLVTITLYSEDLRVLSASGLTAQGKTSMHGAIEAGQTYLVRLSGNATAKITMSNQVPDNDRLDTSRDGFVSPLDALRVINELIKSGSQVTPLSLTNSKLWLDTNLDGQISPLDVLQVFNYMLRQQADSALAATPSAEPAASPAAASVEVSSLSVAAADTSLAASSLAFALSLSASSPAQAASSVVDAVYASLEAEEALYWDDDESDELLLPVAAGVSDDSDDGEEDGASDEV